MKKTTIILPNDLKMRAVKKARKQGISLGEFIRQALKLALQPSKSQYQTDPFFHDERLFTGETPSDLSKNHDTYLYGEDA